MALHSSKESMLQESLSEMIFIAGECIRNRKDPRIWGNLGCYGYPAGILLFAIADAIGEYILHGTVRKHFDILKHPDYYNLILSDKQIDIIYRKYRSLLTHNARVGEKCYMDPGDSARSVFDIQGDLFILHLAPFHRISLEATQKFLEHIRTVQRK